MSILKWKNLNEMLSLKDEMDRLFDSMFDKSSFHSWEERYALVSSGMASPQMSIFERGTDTVVHVDLPGFEKGDVKVSVSGNLLAIGSEINREREFRGNDSYRYQKSYGSFCKVIELPVGADTNNIKAIFSNGVLEVLIPRTGTTTKAPKQIPINSEPVLSTNAPLKQLGED